MLSNPTISSAIGGLAALFWQREDTSELFQAVVDLIDILYKCFLLGRRSTNHGAESSGKCVFWSAVGKLRTELAGEGAHSIYLRAMSASTETLSFDLRIFEHTERLSKYPGGEFSNGGSSGCFQQLMLRLLQALFSKLARGDIARDSKSADGLPRGIAKRKFGAGSPSDAAVRPRFLLDLIDHRFTSFDDLSFVGERLRCVLLGEEVVVSFAVGFLRIRQPKQTSQPSTDHHEAAFEVFEVDRIGRALQ